MAAPHQDDTVLHAPGRCPECDKVPFYQRVRLEQRISFTGERVAPGWSPCPSSLRHPTLKEMMDFARAWRDTYPPRDLTVEEE